MKRSTLLQVLNIVGILAVITVNYLAATLPINNVSTGQVSADYANLFTPAGFTFSIWSLIYLGLLGFSVFQLKGFPNPDQSINKTILVRIGFLFVLTCAANVAWIFAWHHYRLELSLILMALLLTLLIDINLRLKAIAHTKASYWLVGVPFGLYLGWICVAIIANFSVYLTSIEWSAFGLPEITWAMIMIVIASIVALVLIGRAASVAAAFAIAWGLTGIYFRLNSFQGYNYLQMLIIAMIALILIGVARRIRNVKTSGSTPTS